MTGATTKEFGLLDSTDCPDPQENVVEAIIISGDPDFTQYIHRIIDVPSVKLNVSIISRFTSGRKALQNLFKWHEMYHKKASGKMQTSAKNSEASKGLLPIRLIFYDDSTDTDLSGVEFIQILRRSGVLQELDIHFVLFLDCLATQEFREFAAALHVSFIYDINSKLPSLLNFLEVFRCTYIDPKKGYTTDEIYNKGYGPYFTVSLTRIDGKKQLVSLGISESPTSLEAARDLYKESNFFVQKLEKKKKLKSD
jgi:hypothetical protein